MSQLMAKLIRSARTSVDKEINRIAEIVSIILLPLMIVISL